MDYQQDAGIPRSSETHAGEDVAIHASGPMAHLFHKVHEQSYVAHAIMYAACLGPNQNHCRKKPRTWQGKMADSRGQQTRSFIILTMFTIVLCKNIVVI